VARKPTSLAGPAFVAMGVCNIKECADDPHDSPDSEQRPRCRNCNNSGTDFRGNPCTCEYGTPFETTCKSCSNTGKDFLGKPCACHFGRRLKLEKPIFFYMMYSTNAARIRLWIQLKDLHDLFEIIQVKQEDLRSDAFLHVNPLGKVPAFITLKGTYLFESQVIMQYLEDEYGNRGPSMVLDDSDDKAFVNLLVRVHDLYLGSSNSSHPQASSTLACMYLTSSLQEDAKGPILQKEQRTEKLAEVWKQLSWLERQVRGPFMAGDSITHADMTWFPTAVLMDFILPRVFGWPEAFQEKTCNKARFPNLAAWYAKLVDHDSFKSIHTEIKEHWLHNESEGYFDKIKEEFANDHLIWAGIE